jgi:hypothetical protein
MKPKHVHRGLTSKPPAGGSIVNEPVLGVGKLRRIHRNFSNSRRRSRRSTKDKSSYLKYNLRVIFILVAVAFISGVSWMLYQQINRPDDKTDISTLAQETFAIPHPPAAVCVTKVQNFLDCSSAVELSKLARLKRIDAENAYPLFAQFRKAQGEVERLEWIGAEETNGLSLERVVVIYKSGQYRVASLVDVDQGDWRIDFESFISHQTKSWEQIAGQGGCNAVVRAKITPDSYYNGYFQSEKEWICLALRLPDHPDLVYGYVVPQSPAFLDIVEILRVTDPADVIVEIARDAGMTRMQYEIRSVVSQGWVEADEPFSVRRNKLARDNKTIQ